MPTTEVFFYREANGPSPVVEWLEELRQTDVSAYEKCRALIVRLKEADSTSSGDLQQISSVMASTN